MRQAAIICHLGFFTATFSYYVTGREIFIEFINKNMFVFKLAINAVNLSANPVIYVSATGLVDIFGYISSILVLIYCGRKWGCFCFYALAAVCLLVILLVPQDEKTVVVWIAMAGRLGASGAYAIIGLYTTELFPTEVRNSAIGVSSMFGHVGSMMAPFVVDYLVLAVFDRRLGQAFIIIFSLCLGWCGLVHSDNDMRRGTASGCSYDSSQSGDEPNQIGRSHGWQTSIVYLTSLTFLKYKNIFILIITKIGLYCILKYGAIFFCLL